MQLSFMMFVEYFVWGAWYVTMGPYLIETLKATGNQNGNAYAALSIATMISPFVVGLIADRFFAAQKFMGVLHLLGAVLLYLCTQITDPDLFFWVILGYCLLYMPTIALSNSIAFNQLTDAGKQFPNIRVWGTIGWIVVGQFLGRVKLEGIDNIALTAIPFYIATGASLFLGVYSFFLPNTPPKSTQKASISQVLGLDALVLFNNRSYLIFFIASILICIPLSFYYSFAGSFLTQIGMENVTANMTMGQISEALFMIAIPLLYVRLGVKNILILAMLAWISRFLCFGYGDINTSAWLLYLGIILHGICYDFFFVTGYIYTEEKAGEKIKNAAQGLITFATYGVGMFIGSKVSGIVFDAYKDEAGVVAWLSFWLFPVMVTVGVLLLFLLFFRDSKPKTAPTS
jgi:nucleoside transporter